MTKTLITYSKKYILRILMGCILLFTFSSCIGTGNAYESITEIHTTTGKELIDLKKAFDSGAITQEEYDKLKQQIMHREKDKKKKTNKKKD